MTLEGKLQKLLGEQLAIPLPISYNEIIIIRNSECDPMFCPNCGKDCGNSNFCPNCGARLGAQAAAPTAWVPGMDCPHCGGTKLDGKNCAFCGRQLIFENRVVSIPSKGGYYSGTNRLDLNYYYNRYKPDREAALRALRIDTGMGFLEAKRKIDLIFGINGE